LVVVAKEIDGEICFFRAHIMSHKPQEVKVWALDYGFIRVLISSKFYAKFRGRIAIQAFWTIHDGLFRYM
jgi:hypothetical protein